MLMEDTDFSVLLLEYRHINSKETFLTRVLREHLKTWLLQVWGGDSYAGTSQVPARNVDCHAPLQI